MKAHKNSQSYFEQSLYFLFFWVFFWFMKSKKELKINKKWEWKPQLKAQSFGMDGERLGLALMETLSTMREGRLCRFMICCRSLLQWNMECHQKKSFFFSFFLFSLTLFSLSSHFLVLPFSPKALPYKNIFTDFLSLH